MSGGRIAKVYKAIALPVAGLAGAGLGVAGLMAYQDHQKKTRDDRLRQSLNQLPTEELLSYASAREEFHTLTPEQQQHILDGGEATATYFKAADIANEILAARGVAV